MALGVRVSHMRLVVVPPVVWVVVCGQRIMRHCRWSVPEIGVGLPLTAMGYMQVQYTSCWSGSMVGLMLGVVIRLPLVPCFCTHCSNPKGQ